MATERGLSAFQNLHRTTVCAQNPFSSPKRGFINFFFPKKKKLQKEVGERAARPLSRTGYRPKKFQPHLTQKFSVQMGCHREIADSPNRGFFPTKCGGQTRILSRALRPARRMNTDGACAWELPSAHKIHFRGRAGACSRRRSEASRKAPSGRGLPRSGWRRVRENHFRTNPRPAHKLHSTP